MDGRFQVLVIRIRHTKNKFSQDLILKCKQYYENAIIKTERKAIPKREKKKKERKECTDENVLCS